MPLKLFKGNQDNKRALLLLYFLERNSVNSTNKIGNTF